MRASRWVAAAVMAGMVALGSLPAFAALSGATAAPLARGGGAVSASLGYAERDVEDGSLRDEARSRRILFKGAVGIGHGVDLYAFLGLSDIEFRDADFEGNLGETVGLGVRYGGLTLGNSTTRLVFDGQLEYAKSEDGSRTSRMQAYQASIYAVGQYGAAGRIGHFYPYGGLRLSYAEYDNDGFEDFESDDIVGLLAGADYFISPNVFFGTEIHLFDETAIYFSAGYRF